jgi:hypothetical protein
MMIEKPIPENHTSDAEAGYSLRAWLIDGLAIGMGALAVFYYRPDGFIPGLIIFVGAYTLTHSLQQTNWQSLRGLSRFLLCTLGVLIHFFTLLTAPTSITGLVFTFLLPGIAQAYWLWELWPATSALTHPLILMCAAWIALLGVWILARMMLPDPPAAHSN